MQSLVRKIYNRVLSFVKEFDTIEYWEQRAEKLGAFSVINIQHDINDYNKVLEMQKEKIFPHFKSQLKGDEKIVLDFGCGPGRFTEDLGNLINGKAIGVDVIKKFLRDAHNINNEIDYLVIQNGNIPLRSKSVDVIWCCLVLGGITGKSLKKTITEFDRILKDNGLLFLIENTASKKKSKYWFFRQFEDYKRLIKFVNLKYLSEYFDMGERITIMAGRK